MMAVSAVSAVFGVPGAASADAPDAPVESQFGVYNWNLDLTGYDPGGGTDVLNWGAGLVAGTGVRTTRVFLGPYDVYRLGLGATDSLSTVAAHPAYARLFADARFDTYLLTTYSAADHAGVWVDGLSPAEAAAERAEVEALGRRLLGSYPGKRFVVLNWEGDNALAGTDGGATAWAGFRDWIAARSAGVRAAQAAYPGGADRLHAGLEFNRVAGCGPALRCVVSDVAPHADVDLYSYSAWESIGTDTDPGPRVTARMDAALAFIRQGNVDAGPSDIVVGEFGSARDYPVGGECAAAQAFWSVAQAVRGWGVRYAIFWQIVDNPSDPGPVWNNFGLVKYDQTRSLAHQALTRLVGGQPQPAPGTCPQINQGGVLDGVDWSRQISAGEVISIFGTGFAGTGNTVRLQANGRRYVIRAGSPAWYESPTQINARLPADISGTMVVYVRHANGLDSNSQAIALVPR